MSRDEILAILRENVCTIHFKKADSSIREMNCTLDQQYLQKLDLKQSNSDKERKENTNVIAVYDLEKNDWRSFRVDSLIDIQPHLL